MEPITLSENQLDEILNSVSSSTGKEFAAARICRLLARKHSVRTVEVNTLCSVGNISDQVNKSINPRIVEHGFYVACVKPVKPFKNKFDQNTGEMLWSFYDHKAAANDPEYDVVSNEDLEDQYPDLETEDWNRV